MPATFATFPATMTATLAERHAPTRSHGQHGGASHHANGTGAARDGGKLEAQAAMHGGGCNATPQGHKQGAQSTQSGGNVGTVTRVKAHYRGVKMANKAYSKKPPEYTGSKGKPRTA